MPNEIVQAHARQGTRGVRTHYRRTVSESDKKALDDTIVDLEEELAEDLHHADNLFSSEEEVRQHENASHRQIMGLKHVRDFVASWS
jgi:hypothetical protein